MIGISAHTGPVKVAIFDMTVTFAAQAFIDRVAAAGCVPVLLPPLPGIEHAGARLDGLLLLAGPDVEPARYSAAQHPKTVRTDPGRDAAELALLDVALRAQVPVFGICRGMQLLNTACGGTLHQHLPEIVQHENHSPGDGVYGAQRVRCEPGSRTAKILGELSTASCHHHQAIDRLGTGLSATAWAADGTIEAVELADHPFALAVQWHPEQSPDNTLFDALAEAAREHQLVNRS